MIKPIGWRQACLTLFFFVIAVFFAQFNRFGLIFSWFATILAGVVFLLSLLDQLFVWSRLKIDDKGYSLRGWFRHQFFDHHEIEDFKIIEYAGKKLLSVALKKNAIGNNDEVANPIPFPCCFGRPIEEVHKIVRSNIDRTPRARLAK